MKRILTILILVSIRLVLPAQTNNSPYSTLGIGDLEDSYFNRTTSMAGTGIAYRTNRSIINNNPAALTGLENQWFLGELSVRGKYVSYTGNSVDQSLNSSFDIAFRRFAMGTRIGKFWGTGVGLAPFSSENYEFTAQQPILGSQGQTAGAYYQGYGGVNRVFWSNGFEFFHHLSLGVTASYLFGSINQKVIVENPSNVLAYVSTNRNLWIQHFYLDYGLQAYWSLGKHWDVTVGGTFANKQDLNADYGVTVLAIDSSILKQTITNESFYSLPNTYGVGLSITKNKKYTLLGDYKFQQWTALGYQGYNYALRDSYRGSLGFEISHKKNVYNNLLETSYIQAGLYYGQTYLNIFGQSILDRGVTMGFGVNSKRSPMAMSLDFQYGIRGTSTNNLIRENYFSFTVRISYRDFWYTKGKRFN